ncbi:DUF6879 family protein [Streptomyces sp. NPDC051218]|uniref:DUF6879 family protein n=1 Tax=Streptomyces sp. NPDC051218 TaxID=3365645 RepID=UPI00378B3C72
MRDAGDVGQPRDAEAGPDGIRRLVGLSEAERGPLLPVSDYLEAFREDYAHESVSVVDKVECGQHFREPGFASWDAFNRGAWRESMALLMDERPKMARQFSAAEQRGLRLRRVRYIELPVSDYVVWEMAVLRQRVDLGEQVRVLVGQGRPGFQAPPPAGFPNLSFSGRTRSLS